MYYISGRDGWIELDLLWAMEQQNQPTDQPTKKPMNERTEELTSN